MGIKIAIMGKKKILNYKLRKKVKHQYIKIKILKV